MSSRWLIGLKLINYAFWGLGLGVMALANAATPETSVHQTATLTTSTTVTTKHGAVSKTVTTTLSSAPIKAPPLNQTVKPANADLNAVAASVNAAKVAQSSQYANLPLSVYLNALSERPEYDEAFNYVKRGKIANLSTGYNAYRVPRHMVDKVVVYKSHYLMELLKDGKVVRKYWIALSDRPQGDKQYEGDRRTPEGTYTLDYIKERSYFYRAFHISYPNPQDIAEARRLGRRPGGMIMVHGQPPSNSEYEETVQRSNWTNGCIAILNHEIDEFIELVDPGTPIEIRP